MKTFLWQKAGSFVTSSLPRGCVKHHREQSQQSTAAGEETEECGRMGSDCHGVRMWYNPAILTWTGMKWVCVCPVEVLGCQVSRQPGQKHITAHMVQEYGNAYNLQGFCVSSAAIIVLLIYCWWSFPTGSNKILTGSWETHVLLFLHQNFVLLISFCGLFNY